MKNPWIIVGVITVMLFGGAIWYSSATLSESNDGVEVMVHVKGNPDAATTLVEYSDLQCPACAAANPVVNQVLSEFGDSIRFEYKHFLIPSHTFALPAAVAAEAAGQQGKFFEYTDLLFTRQQAWATAAAPSVLFIAYAEELGLDVEEFKRQMSSTVLRDAVRAQAREGREDGVTGTPTFFLNGEKMEFRSYEEFVTQVAFAADPTKATELFEQSSTTPATPGAPVRFGF